MEKEIRSILENAEAERFQTALMTEDALTKSFQTENYWQSFVLPSDYEEHIWLLQHQYPERVLKDLSVWQLKDHVDIARLVLALQSVIKNNPDLTARYLFADDGTLKKNIAADYSAPLIFLNLHSHRQMVEQLLNMQSRQWNSACDTPFSSVIIMLDNKRFLAFISHDILAQAYHVDDIYRLVARVYGGDSDGKVIPRRAIILPKIPEETPSPVEWLKRRNSDNLSISLCNANDNDFVRHDCALRAKALLPAHALGLEVGEQSSFLHEIEAFVSAKFLHFFFNLGSCEQIGLNINTIGWNWQRIVEKGEGEDELFAAISSILALKSQSAVSQDLMASQFKIPWIHIKLCRDDNDLMDNNLFYREKYHLPTCQNQPDIALTITMTDNAMVELVLTCGQKMSPYATQFLLDRFIGFILDNNIINISRHNKAPDKDQTADNITRQAQSVVSPSDAEPVDLILDAFREALGESDMGADDDFFDFGGHSLLATRIIGHLHNAHGIEVNFIDFFTHASAAALASRAVRGKHENVSLSSGASDSDKNVAALSLAQTSLWKAYSAFEFGTIFNLPFALDFIDEVDEIVFGQAFGDILHRHTSLRSLFTQQNGKAHQSVVPVEALSCYKWFWTSAQNSSGSLNDEAAYRFDLSRELPLRLRFFRNPATGRQNLSFLFHHMAIDEWSVNIIMEELVSAYRARSGGKAVIWEKPARQFNEFAHRQHGESATGKHLAYWTAMLGNVTLPPACFCHGDRKKSKIDHAIEAGCIEYSPSQAISDGLYKVARENNASIFNVFYAAIALVLQKLGAFKDIIIGTSASGRSDPEFFETVGYFTVMIAHRLTFDPAMSIGQLIVRARDLINQSLPYADVPIDCVTQALGLNPADGLFFEPYIQIHAQNKLNGTLQSCDGKTIRFRQIDSIKTETMFGLQFEIMEDVMEAKKSIRLVITYRKGHYSAQDIARLHEAIDKVCRSIIKPQGSQEIIANITI